MTSAAPRATSRPLRLAVGSLALREFEAGDADGVHAIVGDDRVTYWLSFESRSRDEARLARGHHRLRPARPDGGQGS